MGFDIDCIPNIQNLPGEYFCPVCRTLVYPNEAHQSQCTHLYCKPCLTYTAGTLRACPYDGYLVTEADSKPLIEVNKALAETIGKIVVQCLYQKSGCTWHGPFSDCTSHCSGCAFGNSPVVCNRCGIQIVHRQVHDHAQNCSGVPQAQQAAGSTAGTAAAVPPSQSTSQSEAPTSHAQTSQTTVATVPGQDPNQQVNANPQAQASVPATVPTPEQWYQQQYQQYYQQYPAYDPYQQPYQQYYPYQQQVIQQFQQHPPNMQGQQQPQAYIQFQPQPPAPGLGQGQGQAQPQPQPQPQPQLQTQSQPQPQIPPQGQPQSYPQAQIPVAPQHQNQAQVNPQQQFHPAVQAHSHSHSQTLPPPPHGHPPLQPQPYPPAQIHPQPYPQQQMQVPQYQQPHLQMHHPQLPVQSLPSPVQPQPSPVQPQPHPQHQSQPHSQSQPQSQLQHHPQPPPQLRPPQPNQPPIPTAQPQTPLPSAHAVTGHHSYPQPQPHQQMLSMAPQQHAGHMHPSSGPLPPAQMQGQFPQPPPQMRPPLSHAPAPLPNQQQSALLPSQGQVPSIPSAQQQQIHSHAQRPVMQPNQHVPQQYLQQQPFPGQAVGPVQSQLHQHGQFAQQQPMQSQIRPQGPPQSMPQNSHTYLQPHQNAALAHGMQSQQFQNKVGRPVVPNHAVLSQPFPQSTGAFGVAAPVRPMQVSSSQAYVNNNNVNRTNNQLQSSTVRDRQSDHISDKSLAGQEVGTPSQKTAEKDANSLGIDSVEVKALKAEAVMNDEQKPIVEGEDKSVWGKTSAKNADSILHAAKDGSAEPVIKQTMKDEGTESSMLEPSEGKDAPNVGRKEADSSVDGSSLLQADSVEGQKVKLSEDAVNVGLQDSTVSDKGPEAVPTSKIDTAVLHTIHPQQHGHQERNMSQAQVTPQDSGVNEFGGFVQSSHQQPPMHHGPSTRQQRPAAPSMLTTVPPGPPLHAQLPGPPPAPLRPQAPGLLPQPGQSLNQQEHFHPPVLKQPPASFHSDFPLGRVPAPGSTASFGSGPGHFGYPPRSFELQSSAPQGSTPGVVPPGSIDPQVSLMGRAPPHGPDGQLGMQRPTNPLETEIFPNQRPHHFDGRQLDSHPPGSLERAPFGQPSGMESNMMRMNGAPGLESFRDERFKSMAEEQFDAFAMEPPRRFDQGSRPLNEYHPGGTFHPSDAGERARPIGLHDDNQGRVNSMRSHPDFVGPVPELGRHQMERLAPRSPGREYPGIPSRGFGGFSHSQSGFDDIDSREPRSFGEGTRSFNLPSDPVGNSFHESRFPVLPGHLRRGELDGPGSLRMGEHLAFGPPNNWRSGGGPDPPSDLRMGDFLDPRNFPSQLHFGEPTDFGSFAGHSHMGELARPGNFSHRLPLNESFRSNKSSHPRHSEPEFRSSYFRHGFPNDGGIFTGGMDLFDKSRKRKPGSTGWCRICKIDCETVEGLDLHSQSREHQKRAMDMVISIKQHNSKKQKTSNKHFAVEEASKSRNTGFEGRGNKP